MAASDLVVLPSAYEGLPNVVLEAMRFRKPVVATAALGTTEVVVDGETGLLVPIGNPPLLARAIRDVIRDPAMAADSGRLAVPVSKLSFGLTRWLRSSPSCTNDWRSKGRSLKGDQPSAALSRNAASAEKESWHVRYLWRSLDRSGRSLEAKELLSAMMSRLVHRGPDDAGEYHDHHSALGFRRLSIIDLSGGHQPLANEDGSVWTVFNGEIYNFPALRRRLEAKGHQLRSTGDTETLVHLYEDEGTRMFSLLRGMFALAIWDVRHRS